ncbi:DinB family protein [Saccharopolyspora gloriosae]|uniref:Putative damage-inducible protein DinB n=1 Tax=Saccharopolyspora gloriosae TaxID=455344 RepID=A0A840NPM1_9PSEU|nr:DinB family protein [Saccharopolyspora gloriosae]MBB5070197.1 putative damage-inducible protein DinB [Saccharopolyspora gloriosae]
MAHHVPTCVGKPDRWIPKHGLDEKDMLRSWLRFGRDTIRAKVRGITADGAAYNPTRSSTSLGGIVKHLTTVEQHWFQEVLGGTTLPMPFGPENPDGDWVLGAGEDLPVLLERYDAACAASDAVIDELELTSTGAQTAGDYTLRWALCHVALDTARHAGQADIIREQWDGERGW